MRQIEESSAERLKPGLGIGMVMRLLEAQETLYCSELWRGFSSEILSNKYQRLERTLGNCLFVLCFKVKTLEPLQEDENLSSLAI